MRTLAILALWAGGAIPQEKGLEIRWIDVEGGAATLIVTPEGESLLMDCGWPGERDAERIARTVREAGLSRIDHFLTSHWHVDHWGGLEELARRVPIARFYDHGFPEGSPRDIDPKLKEAYLRVTGGKSVVLAPGDEVPLKGAAVRILSAHGRVLGEPPGAPQVRPCAANPEHPARPEDASDNARSLGFVLEFRGFRFLNLGDLTWNVEHKLVCPVNRVGTVDVYQVTHHGMDISNHPALLGAVAPTVAVINNGPRKGGSAETYRRLRAVAGLKDVFQVHRNVATGPEDNAPPELVANDGERCEGAGIRLGVEPSGKAYTVEVPSKGTRRTYATKAR
jgi:beta-lactamase superfamily II metal-dependent hydrolase